MDLPEGLVNCVPIEPIWCVWVNVFILCPHRESIDFLHSPAGIGPSGSSIVTILWNRRPPAERMDDAMDVLCTNSLPSWQDPYVIHRLHGKRFLIYEMGCAGGGLCFLVIFLSSADRRNMSFLVAERHRIQECRSIVQNYTSVGREFDGPHKSDPAVCAWCTPHRNAENHAMMGSSCISGNVFLN